MDEARGSRAERPSLLDRLRRATLDALGRSRLGTITAVDTTRPVCALTFDDGPHPHWTPAVQAVLDAHGAKGTFFVLGQHADAHPDVMRGLHETGHALGNHTYRHPSFPLVSGARRRQELRACRRALAPYPQPRRLFRPPFLDHDLASSRDAFVLGYDVVACSLHVRDWEDRDDEAMAQDLVDGATAGDIIMLHDVLSDRLESDRSAMIAALDAFLARRTDLRFVTVHELLTHGRPRRSMWVKRTTRPRIGAAGA